MTRTGPGSVNENGGDLSKRSLTGIDFIRSAASEEKLGDIWLGTLLIATSGRVISGIGLPRTSAVASISIGSACASSGMLGRI